MAEADVKTVVRETSSRFAFCSTSNPTRSDCT
jgi:hypothetical protein